MTENAQLWAVAGAAAAALAMEMTKETWAGMRKIAARFFRHGGEVEEQRQLARLDADQVQAESLDQGELRDRWRRRLMTLVEDYPDAVDDLKALASRHSEDEHRSGGQSAIGNTGPVIQVGRDNFGGLNTEGR
ncbi:hypothetical protein [Streptomyces sp. JJ38]|uniref:hypothetical protein n=1 Tax=Streptomyces sp. JJ38 TaxID=2738128 RepID=UPI001C59062C|nr:hypothetical protein [Streptomyces sp. JJ38]MBW1595958.1 hypothetical protein [Streptomyces sp. JJ38]